MARRARYKLYDQPTGGWGSVKSLAEHAIRQQAIGTGPLLMRGHNKPGGYACTSCAWAKPGEPHLAEFCENGAKATFWDLNRKRTTPDFFARHSITELLGWSDYDIENEGRLTHPMRYAPASDRYLAVSWDEAFADIGAKLKGHDPNQTGYADRLRGIHGSRMIVMMNADDRIRFGIAEHGKAGLTTAVDDGSLRSMSGFEVIDYDIPAGSCAAYFPECNALLLLWHYAQESMTPAAKSIPIRISAE